MDASISQRNMRSYPQSYPLMSSISHGPIVSSGRRCIELLGGGGRAGAFACISARFFRTQSTSASESDDPCRALKNAAKQAILAAHPKIENVLKDKGGMFGNSGWITHGEDLAGRIGTISAMISLGKKMGCDMREEEIMAGALYIPLRPRKI